MIAPPIQLTSSTPMVLLMVLAVHWFSAPCFAVTLTPVKDQPTPVEIFTGAYFLPLPDVLPYDSVIPMIYKVPFVSSVKFPDQPLQVNLCRQSFQRNPNNCQIQNNFVKIQNLITEQMKEEHDIFQKSDSRPKRSLAFVGSFFKWCCDMATQSEIADVVDNEKDITEHANLLIDEVGLDHKDLVMTTEHFNNFSQQVQSLAGKVHDSIRLLQGRIDGLQNTSQEAVQSQMLTLSQQILIDVYFNYYHDNLREARRSCEAKLLPTSLVSRVTLSRDLMQLRKSSENSSLFLAIPPEDQLHLYYTLPITSCKFYANDILITLKVPLRNFSSKPLVFRNIPVPLIWKNKLCHISQNYAITVKTPTGTHILHRDSRLCNEQTLPLCRLPRIAATSDISYTCLDNIMHGADAAALKETCSFICQERPHTPIITELLPNKFLITNIPDQVYVICPEKLDVLLPANKSGTLEIILPCSCSIERIQPSKTNTILVSPIKPCDAKDHNSSSVTHLLPITWSTLHSLSILPLETNIRHKFDNAHGIIDEDWNLTTSIYHTHNLIKEDILNHIRIKHDMKDIINNHDLIMYILCGWMVLITITILICLYCIHILFIKMQPRPPFVQQPALPPRRSSRQRREDSLADTDI